METRDWLLFLPPAMALVWAYFILRATDKSAAKIDAAREALRRRKSQAAE